MDLQQYGCLLPLFEKKFILQVKAEKHQEVYCTYIQLFSFTGSDVTLNVCAPWKA